MKSNLLPEKVNSSCFSFEFLIKKDSGFDLTVFKTLALEAFQHLDICSYTVACDSCTAMVFIKSRKKLVVSTTRVLCFYSDCVDYSVEGFNSFSTGALGRSFAIEYCKRPGKSFIFNFFYDTYPNLVFSGSHGYFEFLESSVFYSLNVFVDNPILSAADHINLKNHLQKEKEKEEVFDEEFVAVKETSAEKKKTD